MGTLPLPVPQFSIGLQSLRGVELLLKMKRGVGDRWRQYLKTNIDAVDKMLWEDARVTYTDIEASLRIGSGSVAKILHIYLRVRKVSSPWVPQSHWQSEGHLSGIVAVKCFGDTTMGTLIAILRSLQVTRPGFASVIQKQSVTHRSGGSLMMIDLSKWKEQKMLGRKWCSLSLLQVVMWQQYHLSIKGQWLHNGTPQLPSHRFSKNCEDSSQELDWVAYCCTMIMPLPMPSIWQWIFWGGLLCSCCPILLTVHTWHPGDFFLFLTVKALLRGKRFSTLEDAVTAYRGDLYALDDSDWRQCFESWFRRMRRCIDAQGEYFDKM